MKLYAYALPTVAEKSGWLKIGETNGDVEQRVHQQAHELNLKTEIVWQNAVITERRCIDKMIHRFLVKQGFTIQQFGITGQDTEWIKCTVADLEKAFSAVKEQLYQDEIQRQAICDKFYLEIRNWYYWTVKKDGDSESVLRLIVRLLFCFFLQDKGLVPKELFDEHFLKENLKANEEYRYYNAVLRNLFFHCLNTPLKDRSEPEHKKLIKNIRNIKEQFQKIPFLNGGLFYEHEGDALPLSNDYFFSELQTRHIDGLGGDYKVAGIIRILSQYQYKLSVDDLFDLEYIETVDPEFIGKVFECLLSCVDTESKESRRKITGSYYTPREIVSYMVNESLDAALVKKEDILSLKILDPACGSGAFPCGVMNEIIHRLDPDKQFSQTESYRRKLDILRNVIYGVDIQPIAVQITALRLFLSLIQEIVPDKKKDNYGIEPLPNLETKFVCANTLIGLQGEKQRRLELPIVKATVEQLLGTRNQHLTAAGSQEKQRLQNYDAMLRKTLSIAMKDSGDLSHNTAEMLMQWNPYDQTKSVPFFDPMWMFGIEKFDVVIGNPPYVVLTTKHPLLDFYRSKFRCTAGGKVNLYKLFFEKGLALLVDGGVLVFITPYNYLTSGDSKKLRKILINETKISEIIDYEESQKVFESSTQAVATIVTRKITVRDYSFRYKKLGTAYTLQTKAIKRDDRLLIKGTNSVISKMNQCKKKFGSIIKGWQGEINVSTKKKHFIDKQEVGCLPLIRGNQIGYYQTVLEPSEFCPVKISARTHHKIRRIVFQAIANAGSARRIKGTILENILCGHSTNYLFSKSKDISLEVILALLNSSIVNYYFKFYNQTNNVPIGEVKMIPIPDGFISASKKLHKLAERRLNGEEVDDKIDELVYCLYGLTNEEIKIVTG
ncbi:MAG: Eco57I restriction-modification methylase domain-containing protein [Planctomycetaceae bacterium]|jgi:type I restriction-modification system DNA methylase subunit|nr:Eco57I restriction-modification methylase domain-containing protein [Planctomycetaceae bacterium]